MKRTAWIAIFVLTLAALVTAQTTKSGEVQSNEVAAQTKKAPDKAAEITYTGCLVAPSQEKGNYSLKTNTANIELVTTGTVNADALKPHVGHTVEVVGKSKGEAVEVSKITMKSQGCTPAASAPSGG